MDITGLKNSLSRKFRGASLDDVQGISDFTIFREAASNLLSVIDPIETRRTMRFNVFEKVYDYEPAEDLKGKKVIDPRPQDGRNGEEFSQTFTKEFDRDKEYGKISVEFDEGQKILRIAAGGTGSASVDQTASTTEWAASGGATGLEIDEVIRLDSSNTLRFDLGAAGGDIEAGVAGTMTQVDLSDDEDFSSFFRKVYIPTGASTITSITIRIGSSSGAYWTITGEPHIGDWKNGVNIIRFDWADAVETGVPSSAAIDYERLTFVTTAAIADVRVGPMTSKLPTPYETPYYSNRIFRDVDTGDWKGTPDDDTDEIVLETEAENLFFYECCQLVAEDLQLDEEAVKFKFKLNGDPQKAGDDGGLYGQYKRDKPTEALAPHSRYMNFRRRIFGGRRRVT